LRKGELFSVALVSEEVVVKTPPIGGPDSFERTRRVSPRRFRLFWGRKKLVVVVPEKPVAPVTLKVCFKGLLPE